MTTDQARNLVVHYGNLRRWAWVAVLAAGIGAWAWQKAGTLPPETDAPAVLQGFGWACMSIAWLSGATFLGMALMRWRAGRLLERADL